MIQGTSCSSTHRSDVSIGTSSNWILPSQPTMSDSDSYIGSQTGVSRVDLEELETRPEGVLEIEQESLHHVVSLVKKLAPHMKECLVLDEEWWEDNRFVPGIHVSGRVHE